MRWYGVGRVGALRRWWSGGGARLPTLVAATERQRCHLFYLTHLSALEKDALPSRNLTLRAWPAASVPYWSGDGV